MAESALAARIHQAAHLTGRFRLRSGATSTEYFDKYLFEADPSLLTEVARGLAGLLPDEVDALAGLELGGVPLVTALSALTGLPARFVRKQAKAYGTCRLAEGGDIAGLRLAVVEDVITSGGQVVESCEELRKRGATIARVVCVIDREAGGPEKLGEAGLEVAALFTKSELDQAAAAAAR